MQFMTRAESLSRVRLFAAPWAGACQAPLSMGFSRQEYWRGLPSPPPGDLPTQGSNLHLLCLLNWQVGSLPLGPPGKPIYDIQLSKMYKNSNKALKGINENILTLLYCTRSAITLLEVDCDKLNMLPINAKTVNKLHIKEP